MKVLIFEGINFEATAFDWSYSYEFKYLSKLNQSDKLQVAQLESALGKALGHFLMLMCLPT